MVYMLRASRALLLSRSATIPLDGTPEAWVNEGALFAVEWDYGDLGRYCGALALRQLGRPGARRRRAHPADREARTPAAPNRWDQDTRRSIDQVFE